MGIERHKMLWFFESRGGGMGNVQVLQPPKPQRMGHFFSLNVSCAEWLSEDTIHSHILKYVSYTSQTLGFPVA